MNDNRTKRAVSNLLSGALNKILTLVVPFLLMTVLRYRLGMEYLGLNNLFSSVLQMLDLAEMGLGSAMVYSLYRPVAMQDRGSICALLKLYRRIYLLLSSVILVIGVGCIPLLPLLVKGTIPEDCSLTALYCIYLSNTVLSYAVFAYKRVLVQAEQRVDVINSSAIAVHICMYVLQFIALFVFRNYYLYILLLPISTVAGNLLICIWAGKRFPQIRPEGTVLQKDRDDIFSRVKALAGHKIGGVVIMSLDSIAISAILGLKAVAVYGCYFYVVRALAGFINVGYNAILPGVGNSLVLEDREQNYRLFRRSSFLLTWFVGWASVMMLCLIQPFIELWMGQDYLLEMHTVVLFVVYFYAWQFRVAELMFKDAAGLWKDDFWKPYIGLTVNLVFDFLLVYFIGIDGALITTIVIMACIYYPWEMRILFRKLFCRSARQDYLRHVTHVMMVAAVSIICYMLCERLQYRNLLVTLFVRGILCTVLSNAAFLAAYRSTDEFTYYLKKIKDILHWK